MFGIGMPEMLLLAAIALIVIGPKKLPDLAKSLGRAMREFKKATSDFKDTLQIDEDLAEVKKAFNDINDDVKKAVTTSTASGTDADADQAAASGADADSDSGRPAGDAATGALKPAGETGPDGAAAASERLPAAAAKPAGAASGDIDKKAEPLKEDAGEDG